MSGDIVERLRGVRHVPKFSEIADLFVCDEVERLSDYNETADEIIRLRRWKAEATEVLARWNDVADLVPAQLGQRLSDAVANEIKRLRSVLSAIDAEHYSTQEVEGFSGTLCVVCDDWWPCQTHRLLHPEEARRER